MKTISEVSKITGLSIRTLRYYDEIGLLKPTQITESGYRLYDEKTLVKLQEILFYRELDFSLQGIKDIVNSPNYNKEQALAAQKILLEHKRNRLNGIIELISDVMEGVNTMSFEAFSKEEVEQIVDHTLKHMNPDMLAEQIKQYGSEGAYRECLAKGFENEQAMADLFKWYGGKEKALQAVLGEEDQEKTGAENVQDNEAIYQQFVKAKLGNDKELAIEAVRKLAENYKAMFCLENARNILLDLAKEYLQKDQLAEVTDSQYGAGVAEYIGHMINIYYGI